MKHLWLIAMFAAGMSAQPVLEHGDVVASSGWADSEREVGTLVVFGRDGQAKGQLAEFSAPPLSEPLVRDGTIYVATRWPPGIQRFDFAGQPLAPLTTAVENVNFLAPAPNGGLFAVNGSCELYQFGADGSLVHFRNAAAPLPSCGGVELAGDGCRVYWTLAGTIARRNACLDTAPELLMPNHPSDAFSALRLLPDGTFLVAMANDAPILHLDQHGNVIRNYGIRGIGLALDIDGTSFWTNEFGWITRVDIASGTRLISTYHGTTYGLSIVGEPRAGLASTHGADVPMLSWWALALMATLLSVTAFLRMR